jgi:hypothetical protein
VGLEYTNVAVSCYFSQSARMSSGDLILVREAAEDPLSADPVLSEVDPRWPGVGLSRWHLAQGAVRAECVVVEQVFGQYPAQVLLIDDPQPVEGLAAQSADHRFADGVRSGRVRWAGDNLDAVRGDYGVEGLRELPGTIPDQELDTRGALAEAGQESARCRCRP